MYIGSVWISIRAQCTKRGASEYRNVGILFLPPLGFGDILMLSPGIAEIKEILTDSKITVITPWPRLVNIQDINWVNLNEAEDNYDLLISPTFTLQHAKKLGMGHSWLGYFTARELQANFPHVRGGYDDQASHYLNRMIPIIETLKKGRGEKFRKSIERKAIHYPPIQTEKMDEFILSENSRYLVAHLCNDDPDRVWDDGIMADLILRAVRLADVTSVVLIGGTSASDRQQCERWRSELTSMGMRVQVLDGVKLAQTAWLISNSCFYMGLDTGPAHLAYLTGTKAWVAFVSMDPEFRLPLNRELNKKTIGFYPHPRPQKPLFNGLLPPPDYLVAKRRKQMSKSDAEESIRSILDND